MASQSIGLVISLVHSFT